MSDLKHWQDKIKEKKKKTVFRNFLKETVSWSPIILHKKDGVITRYPKTGRIKEVLSNEEFEKIRDNLTDYGIDYNLEKGFFDNFSDFMKQSYFPARIVFIENENCDYSDIILGSKNVYLSYVTINNCENILYCFSVKDNCTNVLNSCMVLNNSELCYMTFGVINSFKVFYSRYINNSNNIWFSTNLTGCSECIFCSDLENQNYCIENKKYEKQEYFEKKEEILKDKRNYLSKYKLLEKIGKNISTINSRGNFLVECENIENGYNCYGTKNGRNIILTGGESGNENMYDVFQAGSPSGDDMYGVTGAGRGVKNLFNSCNVNGGVSIFYSTFMEDCSYCIGCIGLRNKNYCILNKQYTKEQWEVLSGNIFSQMEKDGVLGDFFPGELNPFYFNDTMASLLGNFTKQEIETEGYMWREEEIKVDIPKGSEVIKSSDLNNYEGYDSEGSWKINPTILKKVIKDEEGNYYRIVRMEYNFLVKYGLPLPKIHWMDRMKLNFGV